MGRLFGTDGVRGIANSFLSCELALNLGKAAASVLTGTDDDSRNDQQTGSRKKPTVLIGKDTRLSSDMLESAITAGLCSVGADVLSVGIVPTPAVAYLVAHFGCDAAVMISASHNPYEYNGIKLFSCDGYKLPDALEDEIERRVKDESLLPAACPGERIGRVIHAQAACEQYIRHLTDCADRTLRPYKIALDCANGSACATAEKLFRSIGCVCSMLHSQPDGVNINRNAGSTCIQPLSEFVRQNGMDAGFAFDGDADRLIAVDENGNEVDGDKLLGICAKYSKQQGKLRGDVVATVMSNRGLVHFLHKEGIGCTLSNVGDRYVLEKMQRSGSSIGGEPSGHIIFSDLATTGDGQLTAIQVLNIMNVTDKSLSELSEEIKKYPQLHICVPVTEKGKERLLEDEETVRVLKRAEAALGSSGRVLARASGTEPLIRIMLEGENQKLLHSLGEEIAGVIRQRLL